MARDCDHMIESRKRTSKIKSVVATANEESNSMHDAKIIEEKGIFYRKFSNCVD